MSALRAQNGDDFPDAATKHLGDARALQDALRHDGACYLLGYVIECSLKAVRLHDSAWQSASRIHDPQALSAEHARLRKPKQFGHDLHALLTATIGPIGARYVPDLPAKATIKDWSEVRRYQPPDPDAAARASSWMSWAQFVYETTIVQMTLDGVL